MIDFELDESQLELQGAARRLFAEAGGLALARRLMEEREGFSAELWRTMVSLDWAGLAIPETFGGSGGGVLDLYALCAETGRAIVTSPLIPSSVVAAHVLASCATDAESPAGQLLGQIASGAAIVIPAVLEVAGLWEPDGIATSIESTGGALHLNGTKVLVPFADIATRLLVAALHGDGISLALIDPTTAGVSITALDNLAGLSLFAVEFNDVPLRETDVLGEPGGGWSLLAPALARGAVLRAAEVAGAGETMLEMAVTYAQQRRQFGKAIGSNQAVQYLCTDIGIESHLTALLSRRAAWLLDAGLEAEVAVAAAKLYASRAASHMAQQAHEVFAGLAFMMEHDLHLITRHAKHWEYDFGDVDHHGDALVTALEAAVSAL